MCHMLMHVIKICRQFSRFCEDFNPLCMMQIFNHYKKSSNLKFPLSLHAEENVSYPIFCKNHLRLYLFRLFTDVFLSLFSTFFRLILWNLIVVNLLNYNSPNPCVHCHIAQNANTFFYSTLSISPTHCGVISLNFFFFFFIYYYDNKKYTQRVFFTPS